MRLLLGPCSAFWVMVLVYRLTEGEDRNPGRFLVGLVLGAIAAHFGWALLHLHQVAERPGLLLVPAGFTWLAVPAGFFAASVGLSWRVRRKFLDATLASLPAGLGVAKLGCHLIGCCAGIEINEERVPTALFESAALCALFVLLNQHGKLRRSPGRLAGAALFGMAAIRGLSEPWRAPSLFGEPWIPISGLVGVWALTSLGLLAMTAPRGSHLKGK